MSDTNEDDPADAPPLASDEELRWLAVPPPDGAPWDLSIDDTPWLFLDCEMTGVEPDRDALIEIAARRVRGGVTEGTLSTLVRSAVPSNPAALATHGINPAMLLDAPELPEALRGLATLLEGAVPVLHGGALDRAFLNRAFAECGHAQRITHVVDTLLLARRGVLARSYRLSAVAELLGIPSQRWHRASEDVLGIQRVFEKLQSLFAPESARDLWQIRAGVRLPTQVRDAVTRRLEAPGGEALALVARQPGRTPRRVVGRVVRWDPPHVTLGLGASGRYRGLLILRADRILRVESVP